MFYYENMKNTDLKACASLFQKAFQQPPWNENWTYEQAYQRLEESMSSPMMRGYLIKDHEDIIAMACGRIMTYMSYQEFWIDDLCVLDSYQGQGIGSQLLDFVKDELQKEKINRIVLNTLRSFLSEKFYRKNGFIEDEKSVVMLYQGVESKR